MAKRISISKSKRRGAWEKTKGRCHFCGGNLRFNAKRGSRGRWNVDHILPVSLGGTNEPANLILICGVCNRLKSDYNSKQIKKMFRYGEIAYKLARNKKNKTGEHLRGLYNKRKNVNKSRRKHK